MPTAPDKPDSTATASTRLFLRVQKLEKRFGEGPAVLEDINLQLKRGDFLALIGPSGCGKSTLLKLMAELIQPSSGSIEIGYQEHSAEISKGFVFQDANLLPWASIRDNVSLPLKLAGKSRQKQLQQADAMLSLVGLSHAAEQYPRELSGGMRMRASIARALTTRPELLLLDEPFGALDEMTRDDLNEELLQLREQQKWTSVFVTHSVTEAVFLANKVAVMSANPGRIHELISIDMPYPRTAEIRTCAYFQEMLTRVTRSLHSVRHSRKQS